MVSKLNFFGIAVFLSCAGLTLAGHNAYAQQAQTNQEGRLEEVTVTGTRRETSLATTPIAISALTGDMLQKANISDLSDLAGIVTGLNLVDQGPGLTRPVIRGLQGVGDAQVGVYIDNTPITGSPGTANSSGRFGPEIKPIDMQRVEVLRGPQGTLYGGSAMGGAIRFITNKPDASQFEGRFSIQAKSYEGSMGYQGYAVFNAPLVKDKLALRAVAYARDDEGYIDNVVLGTSDINDIKTQGGRLAIGWKPNDTVEVIATYYYENQEGGSRPIIQMDLPGYQTRNPGPDTIEDEVRIFNLTTNIETDWADIVYSYSKYDRDLFYRYSIVIFPFGPPPPNFGGTLLLQPQDVSSDVHELRIVSNQDGPWQWAVGAFYSERDSFGESDLYALDSSGQILMANGSPGGQEDQLESLLFRRFVDQSQTEKAVYGELSYTFSNATTLTLGTRVFEFDNRDGGQRVALFGAPFPGNPPFVGARSSHNGEVFKLHLAREVSDDSVIYAQWSQGFRAGGLNVEALTAPFDVGDTPLTFKPDEVDNYEIGFRGMFKGGLMTLAAAAFYIDWKDMFVNQDRNDLAGGNLEFRANAGQAEILGFELEFEALLGDDFKVTAGTTIIDAKLATDIRTFGDSTGALDGDTLPFVPDYTFNVSAEYGWPIGHLRAYVRGGYRYTGVSSGDFNPFLIDTNGPTSTPNIQYTRYGKYGIANLRFGIEGDQWTAALFVSNVFNERECVYLRRDFIRPQPGNCFVEKPRTIGVRFSKGF